MPFFPQMMGYPQQSNQYPVDYGMSCSNSCGCRSMCIPWFPCGCRCPPPCPPTTTTTTTPFPTLPPNRCVNGAPDWTFPFCCHNGNLNPECADPTAEPPSTVEPSPSPPPCNGKCCMPCRPCMPCMIWWMCMPCNNGCNNGCQSPPQGTPPTEPSTLPPLNRCDNGAPDFTFPFCCHNGASNAWCCTNGANNPECVLFNPPVQREPINNNVPFPWRDPWRNH